MQSIKVHKWNQPTEISVVESSGDWGPVVKNTRYRVDSIFVTLQDAKVLKLFADA